MLGACPCQWAGRRQTSRRQTSHRRTSCHRCSPPPPPPPCSHSSSPSSSSSSSPSSSSSSSHCSVGKMRSVSVRENHAPQTLICCVCFPFEPRIAVTSARQPTLPSDGGGAFGNAAGSTQTSAPGRDYTVPPLPAYPPTPSLGRGESLAPTPATPPLAEWEP